MADEKMLNGLRPDKINAITDSMRDDPEVLKGVTGPWKSRVVWQGGFRAKAYMRKHVVEMDEPEGLDATDAAASAHEQLLSAMGSCLTVGFVLNATKRGVRIHDLEVALEGNFENILKWAGHSTTGARVASSVAPGSSLGRMSLDKQFLGELAARGKGEMLTAMTDTAGSARA